MTHVPHRRRRQGCPTAPGTAPHHYCSRPASIRIQRTRPHCNPPQTPSRNLPPAEHSSAPPARPPTGRRCWAQTGGWRPSCRRCLRARGRRQSRGAGGRGRGPQSRRRAGSRRRASRRGRGTRRHTLSAGRAGRGRGSREGGGGGGRRPVPGHFNESTLGAAAQHGSPAPLPRPCRASRLPRPPACRPAAAPLTAVPVSAGLKLAVLAPVVRHLGAGGAHVLLAHAPRRLAVLVPPAEAAPACGRPRSERREQAALKGAAPRRPRRIAASFCDLPRGSLACPPLLCANP